MAENQNDHRFARAAGRATRAFRDSQRRDDERLRGARAQAAAEDEERLAERRREREQALDERDAAEAGVVHPLLRLARRWWVLTTLVLFALATVFIVRGLQTGPDETVVDLMTGLESVGPLGGRNGQFTLGAMAAGLGLFALWGTVGLFRRHAAAVTTLTTLTAVVAVPSALRGNGFLILLSLLLVVGTVMIWLPAVRSRLRRGAERAPDAAGPQDPR